MAIPRNFSGVVQIQCRHGRSRILPDLAGNSRVLFTKKDEIWLLVGHPTAYSGNSGSDAIPSAAEDLSTDFCQLRSKYGKVTIGFNEEDPYLPPSPNVWEKIGNYFKGGKE